MLIHHKAKGFLPIWTAWGQDKYCKIGTDDCEQLSAKSLCYLSGNYEWRKLNLYNV